MPPDNAGMLHLDPIEMKNAHRSAVLSAEVLRQAGEAAKAARLESLARILERRLAAADSAPAGRGVDGSARSGVL